MINRKYIICAAINDSGRTVSRMVTIKSFFTKMSLHMALDFVRHTTGEKDRSNITVYSVSRV